VGRQSLKATGAFGIQAGAHVITSGANRNTDRQPQKAGLSAQVQENDMPRKVNSAGESTQDRHTSMQRAMGAQGGQDHRTVAVTDGGKWAGSGSKTVTHHEGPKIARQAQPGRGAKTRGAERSNKRNHPNHG